MGLNAFTSNPVAMNPVTHLGQAVDSPTCVAADANDTGSSDSEFDADDEADTAVQNESGEHTCSADDSDDDEESFIDLDENEDECDVDENEGDCELFEDEYECELVDDEDDCEPVEDEAECELDDDVEECDVEENEDQCGGGGDESEHPTSGNDAPPVRSQPPAGVNESDGSDEAVFETVNVAAAMSCKKRKRWPKGVKPPEGRLPRGIGAIETAMRTRRGKDREHIFEPLLGMVFDSRAEAYKFYNLYSWEVGFGIRFGTSSRNRSNKYRTMQEIVCEKEGFDSRCTSSSKRDRCKAKIRLHRTEDHGWYISSHVADHNHPLSVSCGEKREWNSHSKIEDCTKGMIRHLRLNNVTISRVHSIMGDLYNGMDHVPFNHKSLRSLCNEIARDQRDDDVMKTARVFRKMRAADPGFQFSVDLDDDRRIKTLLWTGGKSRSQWMHFGDVVTFDTTYCTNLYKMPFGIFVGVNNHFQSVLFAGVLMRDETASSFEWVFREFLTLMGGKPPVTIFTDQCKAMRKAIRIVFPGITHLWCKWHVLKDAPVELGKLYLLKSAFRREFHYIINEMLTVDEFERAWSDLLDRYSLHDHPFMLKTYKKREMWAKPWAKDKFCARMASTQRSESANSLLKKFVPRNSSMNRFVEQYGKLLFVRDAAEQKAEHQTKQIVKRSARMIPIEKHAICVYTRKAYELFSAEVDKANQYNVHAGTCGSEFTVVHYNAQVRQHWRRSVFTVKLLDGGERLSCECGLYEHLGMLCCHAIKVLIHRGISKIPTAHILKRWTREATHYEYPEASLSTQSPSDSAELRQSVLYVSALDVVGRARNDNQIHDIVARHLKNAMMEINRLTEWRSTQPGYCSPSDTPSESASENEGAAGNSYGASGTSSQMSDAEIENMQAPLLRRAQGRPECNRKTSLLDKIRKGKKKRSSQPVLSFCERCQEEGHSSKQCPLRPKTQKKKKIVVGGKKRRLV